MKIYPLAIVVFLIPWAVLAKQSRDDWIDPNDMLNFDPSTGKMKRQKVVEEPESKVNVAPVSCQPVVCPRCPEPSQPPPRECKCEQAALPLMRQYIKTLLSHLDGQMPFGKSEDYVIHITLSEEDSGTLQRFVESGNPKHIHDAHYILSGMIKHMSTSRLGKFEKTLLRIEDRIGISLHRVIQLLALVALASLILYVEVRLKIRWRRRITQIIVLMFLISIPWTWLELYKQAEIKQHSAAARDVPPECQNGDESFWSYAKSIFTFKVDKCHAYYEHIMIDPIVKVPPTKAIAITFVRFFVSPLKDVGTAISEFLKALLIDLPLTLYPIALVMVAFFCFLLLFMGFGYRIRLPFFLTIEPMERPAVAAVGSAGDKNLQQAIETNQQVVQQLEKLQQQLESSEMAMSDKLQHLQQVQQAAIEYTMSSASSTPTPSPSISRSNLSRSPRESKYTKYENAESAGLVSDLKSTALYEPDNTGTVENVSKTAEMNGVTSVDNMAEKNVPVKNLSPAGDSNMTVTGIGVPGPVTKCVVDTLVHDQSFDRVNKS